MGNKKLSVMVEHLSEMQQQVIDTQRCDVFEMDATGRSCYHLPWPRWRHRMGGRKVPESWRGSPWNL